MGIKEKLSIEKITKDDYRDWLLYKHYAKRIPLIKYAFGLRNENNKIVGVCTYGPPARMMNTPQNLFNKKLPFDVDILELNRLITNENLEKNSLSFFVSKTFALLPKPLILVSYSDEGVGHHGYIYQATNWIYTGMTRKENIYLNKQTGKILHPRTVVSLFGSRSKNSLPDYIQILKEEKTKHRYFQFLGNKKEIKFMLENFKYCRLQYPKGNNIRYDTSYEVKKIGFFEE